MTRIPLPIIIAERFSQMGYAEAAEGERRAHPGESNPCRRGEGRSDRGSGPWLRRSDDHRSLAFDEIAACSAGTASGRPARVWLGRRWGARFASRWAGPVRGRAGAGAQSRTPRRTPASSQPSLRKRLPASRIVVVELIGGCRLPRPKPCFRRCARGAQVVTANKAAVAETL